MAQNGRVAIVHHWLVGRRGGERCLEVLARLLPGADLFTLVHDEARCPAPEGIGRVVTSAVQRWGPARRHFRALLPLFPRLYGALDLSGYDVVITSDASVAKCVRVPSGALHLCYCYSPVRYAWDLAELYLRQSIPAPLRPLARWMLSGVRSADRAAAGRVDRFVAISEHVRRRIESCYERTAEVVHPPVDTVFFQPGDDDDRADPSPRVDGPRAPAPYLVLGEAVAYKRFDIAVEACALGSRPLIVSGAGARLRALQRRSPGATRFVLDPDDATVRRLYRQCRALLFPGEEDFGLVPVEAMACGRPVIALGRGGVTETVVDGSTGVLYDDDSPRGMAAAVDRFEAEEDGFLSSNAVQRAGIFSIQAHERAMSRVLAGT